MAGVRINAESLKALRQRSGYSVTQFATAVGITPSHLSNIEAGRRQAAPTVVLKMAEELKLPVTAILSNPEQAIPA